MHVMQQGYVCTRVCVVMCTYVPVCRCVGTCVWCVHMFVVCVAVCVHICGMVCACGVMCIYVCGVCMFVVCWDMCTRVCTHVLVAVSMHVSLAVSALEQEVAQWAQCGWPWWGVLLILAPWAGLVMEGECAGVRDVGTLHGGDGQHGRGCHFHPDHQQHCEGRLPDHLQLHRLEQLWLRHRDHPAQGARWGSGVVGPAGPLPT